MHREISTPESLLGDGLLNRAHFGLLYGTPNVGKTWSLLDLALALTQGKEWLGMPGPARPLRVGCLMMELPDYFLKARLARLIELAGGQVGDALERLALVYRPRLQGTVDLVREEDVTEIGEFCTKLGLDLLILDPLSRMHSVDEKDAAKFAPVLNAIEELRLETNTAILLSHHVRKEQGSGRGRGNVLDEIRGTSRLQSDPTVILRLAEYRGLIELSVPKSNFAAAPDPVYLRRLERGGFETAELPPSSSDAKRERKGEVLAAVRANTQGLSAKDVREASGAPVSLKTVKEYLAELQDEGQVELVGSGPGTKWVPVGGENEGQWDRHPE